MTDGERPCPPGRPRGTGRLNHKVTQGGSQPMRVLIEARAAGVACLSALMLATGAVQAADRPTVGLVLGGGGARGAAHIGVLEVLEQMRVPIDCVAGTSMGALVAGAWAAGIDTVTMRRKLAEADWNDMFQDNPGYDEFNIRNKRLAQRYLPGSEIGISERGALTPPGVVSGQKIKLFFNQLVHADAGERLIETLSLPVAIIATDIGTGERVVFRDGSLTLAMRASMSVPGLMSPLEYRGRKLVDGGLVDNLPVAEARALCNADVVIAVNVGSPLLRTEDISGLLSVSAQMVSILTEQNVTRSLDMLQDGDIYIKPELDGLTAGDFQRNAEAADRGRAAAQEMADSLKRLSVDEPTYAAWQNRWHPVVTDRPRVDAIEIAGLETVNPATLDRYVQQRPGELLDTETLNRDLMRVFGDGWYERVDYTLIRLRDRNVLRITPVEKSWGPDYLRLGLNLDTTLTSGSTYSLRAAYQKTWINHLGGELLFGAELGSDIGVLADWYQPLDASQRYFAELGVSARRDLGALYIDDQRLSEYHTDIGLIDLVAGVNLSLLGRVQFGWREEWRRVRVTTGLVLVPPVTRHASGWLAAVELDQLDRLYLPTNGWSLRASWFEPPARDYNLVNVGFNMARPVQDWVLAARATYAGSTHGELPAESLQGLGGLLNLSGFAPGQLLGDKIFYGHVRAERIIGRMPMGLRGDMRVGFALEAAHVGMPLAEPRRTGMLDSIALYLGGETPFGPVYFGIGHSSGGPSNIYLAIGTP